MAERGVIDNNNNNTNKNLNTIFFLTRCPCGGISCGGWQKQVEDGSGFLNEEDEEGGGRRHSRGLAGCSPSSLEGTEDCVINAQVVGNSLEIYHWSTLWSQPQLKRKLLIPLNGIELHCSRDGTKATLDFASSETAKRALRICNLARSQVCLSKYVYPPFFPLGCLQPNSLRVLERPSECVRLRRRQG